MQRIAAANDRPQIHERLAGVVIECLAWPEFLARYDSPTTLFYLVDAFVDDEIIRHLGNSVVILPIAHRAMWEATMNFER